MLPIRALFSTDLAPFLPDIVYRAAGRCWRDNPGARRGLTCRTAVVASPMLPSQSGQEKQKWKHGSSAQSGSHCLDLNWPLGALRSDIPASSLPLGYCDKYLLWRQVLSPGLAQAACHTLLLWLFKRANDCDSVCKNLPGVLWRTESLAGNRGPLKRTDHCHLLLLFSMG